MIKLGLSIDDAAEESQTSTADADLPPLEGDAEESSKMEEVD